MTKQQLVNQIPPLTRSCHGRTARLSKLKMEQQSVAAGVRTDCEALIAAFRETNSLRYEDFTSVWRAKNMSFIFCGREDDRELSAFIEESLAIAKSLWLSRRADDQMKMGGFYLVYAFYMKQPMKSPLKIRLTPNDWDSCMTFVTYVIQNGHTDALFIFRTLLRNHAFHFVYLPLELHPRSNLPRQERMASDEHFRFEDRLQEYTKDESFQQFQAFHERYHAMKNAITEKYFPDQPGSLAISDCNIMQQIKDITEECTRKIRNSLAGDGMEAENSASRQQEKKSEDVGTRRVQLKKEQFIKKTKSKDTSPHKHKRVETVHEEGETSAKKAKLGKRLIWRQAVIKGSDSEDSNDSSMQ